MAKITSEHQQWRKSNDVRLVDVEFHVESEVSEEERQQYVRRDSKSTPSVQVINKEKINF